MAESWRGLSCGSERENVKLILEREEEQVQNRQILTVRTEIRSGCAVQSLVRGGLVSTVWASCAGVLVLSSDLFRGIGSLANSGAKYAPSECLMWW